MLIITAHINDIFTHMLIDTGGGCSIVDSDLVKHLPYTKSNTDCIKINLISGQTYSMNEFITATITYENSSVNLRLFVVENFPYPVLLGIDWCRAAKVKIDFSCENDVLLTEGWLPLQNNFPVVTCGPSPVDVRSSLVISPFEQKLLNVSYDDCESPQTVIKTIKSMRDLLTCIERESQVQNCVKTF
ncbi:hypothetical protein B4U80_14918 [Leptotrombidium deliense]|uniref:Peptidase A2 domain-containing protein n=1 Tax=Leptotrombidium deliense TaxID=299467 RepID=A0A443S124_9ACAR|nr:hypothetical protein B4U80_14918 [Leptotrombidium deliense]